MVLANLNMPRKAEVVIGANFGDEGKGLVTDFLSARHSADVFVVRHNGGAQAGHTVVTPDGKRHVFKHFGSGTFAGARTILSRFYVCNPILFFREKELLNKSGVKPIVYIDPRATVSTPYDMMINQLAEDARGGNRHGSCGLGFGETVERNQWDQYGLQFKDLTSPQLKERLQFIQTNWVPQRLAALDIPPLSPEWQDRISSGQILNRYLEVVSDFLDEVTTFTPDVIGGTSHIIFEGAQGLLLDQERGFFPHVTRSHTGIRNAVDLALDYGISKLEVTYVTRAYATRHGVGPFPHELENKPYSAIHDPTNVHNEYQGALRFGWLDLNLLQSSIQADLEYAPASIDLSYGIAVTCLDQIEDPHSYILNGLTEKANAENFLGDIHKVCRPSFLIKSYGSTRQNITT